MITKILLVQPFLLEKEQLTDEILIWEVYIENYLKEKLPHLQFDMLYLPIEQDLGRLTITSFKDEDIFEKEMFNLTNSLNFELDANSLIGISITTSNHYLSGRLIADFFQKHFPEALIILGGTHISARPYDFANGKSLGDYIILGEGELTLYNLISKSFKKQKVPRILKSDPVEKLDDLPEISFSILDKYITHFNHLSINLSRGCPFNCFFCMENMSLNNKNVKNWRVYNPIRAIKEVKNMRDYGSEHDIDVFGFYDPIFGMNQKWLKKFLDLYKYEDHKYTWIETRLDILNEELLEKLNRKKFYLMYGLETFSKEMLNLMNKTNNPNSYLKKFEKLYLIHKKLNSFFMINILINHPGETLRSQLETFNRLEEMILKENIDADSFNIRFYHHFPGTRIYNDLDFYNRKYGTRSFFPDWFKREDLLKFGSYAVQPSGNLSLRKSFNYYTDNYLNLLNFSIKNEAKNRQNCNFLNVLSLKKQMKLLKHNKENFFKFLDEKKIEMD